MHLTSLPAVPEDLIEALKNNRAIAIVGSGLSCDAGAPSRRDLLLRLTARAEELCPQEVPALAEAIQAIDQRQYFASASIIKGVLKHQLPAEIVRALTKARILEVNRNAVNQAVAGSHVLSLFSAKAESAETPFSPTDSHHVLVQLGFRAIITTNYDKLLWRALPREQLVKTWKLSWSDRRLSGAVRDGTPFILKLHGDIDHRADLILAREDYDNVLHNEPLRTCLQSLFGNATPFWIGYGHNDINLDLMIDQLGLNSGFAVAKRSVSLERRFQNAKIFASWLSSDDQIPAYLHALARELDIVISREYVRPVICDSHTQFNEKCKQMDELYFSKTMGKPGSETQGQMGIV